MDAQLAERLRHRLILKLVAAASVLAVATAGPRKEPDVRQWWTHVKALADDNMEGREAGTDGHRLAAAYVASEFHRAGLEPCGDDGYFQKVPMRSRVLDEPATSLKIGGQEVTLGQDALISMRSRPPQSLSAPLVFAGYGLRLPDYRYDDFAGTDVRGKVVVYLTGGPGGVPGAVLAHYQSSEQRLPLLRSLGAVGAIGIASRPGDLPWDRIAANRKAPAMELAEGDAAEFLSISLNRDRPLAASLFDGAPISLAELSKMAVGGKRLRSFALKPELEVRVRFTPGLVDSINICGKLSGSDRSLSREAIAVTAHLDHLGKRSRNGDNKDIIYNGAMDNASGVATLIETALTLGKVRKRPRRPVLFVAVTAEEKGLLGSRWFAERPPVPVVAGINMDMFLPLYPMRSVLGLGAEESTLGLRLQAIAPSMGLAVQADPEPERNRFIRSDQYSFIREGIPALALKVGYEPRSKDAETARRWQAERYHGVTDDVSQPVDMDAAATFNELVRRLVEDVANQRQRPQWYPQSFFGNPTSR